MTAREWWPVAWFVAFVADVVAVVVAVVAGNWFAVVGWLCAALAALSAVGSGAMLVRLHRDRPDWF